MKTKLSIILSFATVALFGPAGLLAQEAVPEAPQKSQATEEAVIQLDPAQPLLSLEKQVRTAEFDHRGAFAKAFDRANESVDAKIAELKSRGLTFADAAENNLATARDQGRQAFRDLSLTTEETWKTARDNATSATRKIRGALEDLEKTAAKSGT